MRWSGKAQVISPVPEKIPHVASSLGDSLVLLPNWIRIAGSSDGAFIAETIITKTTPILRGLLLLRLVVDLLVLILGLGSDSLHLALASSHLLLARIRLMSFHADIDENVLSSVLHFARRCKQQCTQEEQNPDPLIFPRIVLFLFAAQLPILFLLSYCFQSSSSFFASAPRQAKSPAFVYPMG